MTGKQLRNSILQWAIQGKLVPQDPNDEPASFLLKRIREEKARLVKEKKIKKDKNESIIYRGEDNSYYEKTLATGSVKCIDDEIPFDIPQSWEWVRLGAFVQVKGGKRIPVGAKLTTENTGQIYIRVSDMKEYSVIDSDIHYVPYSIQTSIASYTISSNDVYITVAGTIGRVGLIPSKFDGANLTENANKLSLYEGDKEYLMYILDSPFVQQQIIEITTKVGQPKLAIIRIQNLLIPICPLQEQVRIASCIRNIQLPMRRYESCLHTFTKLNERIGLLLRYSLLQEAIQGKLVPQIETEGTAEELLEEIRAEKQRLVKEGKLKKSALAGESRIFRGDDNKYYEQIGSKVIDIDGEIPFNIPETWRWIRLGYIIDFSSNSSTKSENIHQDAWILDLEDIEKDSGILLRRKKMSESNAKSDKHGFYAGNILYSKLRPYLNKVLIADMDGYCTSEILAFDFGKINSEYALAYLRSPFFVEYAMSDAYGVKMPRLGSKQGNNALMPIPPLDEQHRIVNQIRLLKSQL